MMIKTKTLIGDITTKQKLTGSVNVGKIYTVGTPDETETYILVTEDGTEFPAVMVEDLTMFDATPNDIREGKLAVTDTGVTVGTKNIPAYRTHQGVQVITAGSEFKLKLANYNAYDYTNLQVVICEMNTTLNNSTAVVQSVINDYLYAVLSTEPITKLVKNDVDKTIYFGISNGTDKPCIIRYFTYRLEE